MSPRTFECPNCCATVVVGKKVCRECGSDDSTGWLPAEELDYQSIEIHDGYGPDVGADAEAGLHGRRFWVTAVALLMLVVLVMALVLRF